MRYTLILFFNFFLCTASLAAPNVVVSLKPIAGLVNNVTEGVTQAQVLLPDGASPHTYQLKPSQRKAIENAHLIIWVGPTLENYLAKSLSLKQNPVLTLMDIPELNRLEQRHDKAWAHHDTHEHHHHAHEHHADNHTDDPHIWLSVANAKIIVRTIAQKLIEIDPSHATQYRHNESKTLQALATLQQTLAQQLAPFTNQPFLVYHDGYQYFEKAFQLKGVGSVILNPEVPPSVQAFTQLADTVSKQGVRCIFTDAEFNTENLQKYLKTLPVKVVSLDPLGMHENEPQVYFKIMQQLGTAMTGCFRNE